MQFLLIYLNSFQIKAMSRTCGTFSTLFTISVLSNKFALLLVINGIN